MANDIVWFDSSETGAPALTNVAGTLDAVLHACLVTGFNPIALTSLSVTANVATATYAAGHGYGNQRMVDIGLSPVGALNGRKLITVTGASTFTFPAPGVADGPAGGSPTAKRSPLGWARPHSSGNVSIYTRTDVTATGMALRIDDTATTPVGSTMVAKCLMVETATGPSVYTGPAPAVAQNANGVYWYKGANTATAQRWMLVGDSKRFYLFTEGGSSPFSTYGTLFPHGFGDLNPYRSGDAYHAFIAGSESPDSASQAFRSREQGSQPPGGGGFYLARPATQIGTSVLASSVAAGQANAVLGAVGPLYPSYVDNGFAAASPVFAAESNSSFGHPIRGELPGLSYALHAGVGRLLHGSLVPNLLGTTREHLMVGLNTSGSSSSGGLLIDVTGPW